jgi:2-polyprenyl-3-methyl-5-hydroxy-6-metoxy-1,4-benzoquinol methylase
MSTEVSADHDLEHRVPVYSYKNPTREWLHGSRRDWIIAKVRQCAPSIRRRKALDVGFGAGVYLPVLAELFDEVVGIDTQEVMLDYVRPLTTKYSNLRVVAGDIANCGLPSASFNLIICSEVIEHIADSQKSIGQLYNLLEPGGLLILSTPQRWSLLELMARVAYLPGMFSLVKMIYREQPIFDPGHINLMTEKEVVRQLETAGFSVRERYKSGAYMPVVADLMGRTGLRFAQWIEPKIRSGPLNGVLWVQYYVAEKRQW